MNKTIFKTLSLICCVALIMCVLGGCGTNNESKIVDIITNAETVYINGTQTDTVEAAMGAFQGKQGDYIEFRFTEPQTFNTIFINEKTATVRQYNIYAEIDGKFTLVHTGKNIFQENIVIDSVTATALKLEIVNTEIGNDTFTIQGISAYLIQQGA